MKKFIAFIAVISASVCIAGPAVLEHVAEDVSATSTNAATTTFTCEGALDGFYIDVAAGSTNGVTISNGRENLLVVSGVTADTLYRVRFPSVTSTGDAIASSTNSKAILSDKLTITATGTQPGAADVVVKVIMGN